MSNNIKSSDLLKIWSSPDSSRLIPKQISIRLPLHVAAKIYALEELYPTKSRTQIIGDLLSTALEELEDSLPSVKGNLIEVVPRDLIDSDEDMNIYKDDGIRGRYFDLYTKHITALEKELGNKDLDKTYRAIYSNDVPDLLTSSESLLKNK